MSRIREEILAANEAYARSFGDKGALALPRDIPIYGYIYDVHTGRLVEVPQATEIGAAS